MIELDISPEDQFVKEYEMPVSVHKGVNNEQIEFLMDCNYELYADAPGDRLALKANVLKKREQKYNTKISACIDKMKRSYK